jgi:glycosyltransferase involved in cell wall biosynthesis
MHSVEQVLALLTEELVRRGHQVTLFATGDSETSAHLHAEYARGYEMDDELWNWQLHESMNVAAAYERADYFDIIHSHAYEFALPFTRLVATPSVHTHHIVPDSDLCAVFERYPEAHRIAISHYQATLMRGIPPAAIVHHGIDVESFPFAPTSAGYLAFLGRLTPDKGPLEAIEIAREAGMPLVMAGPAEDDYHRAIVAPALSEAGFEYIGAVDHGGRATLLAGAAALVFPIQADEPFGLVMVEAMACGTPVLALQRGAVPEIVESGVTGYCEGDVMSLARRVSDAITLDRAAVRAEAIRRFGYRRMVDGYEAVYARLVGNRLKGRTTSSLVMEKRPVMQRQTREGR